VRRRSINVLAVDPATSRLYSGGNGDWGLWRRGDGGRSWVPVLPNVLHAEVGGIAIDATGTYLDAATYGLGGGAHPPARGSRSPLPSLSGGAPVAASRRGHGATLSG
jgi:hypothetical protein